MKIFINFFILGIFIFSAIPAVASTLSKSLQAHFNIKSIIIDGIEKTANTSFIVDGVAYVPLREIAETLKSDVYWDSDEKSIYITNDNNRNIISEEQAMAIALNRTEGGIVKMILPKLKNTSTIPIYKIKILKGYAKYDVTIDAINGNVISFSEKAD